VQRREAVAGVLGDVGAAGQQAREHRDVTKAGGVKQVQLGIGREHSFGEIDSTFIEATQHCGDAVNTARGRRVGVVREQRTHLAQVTRRDRVQQCPHVRLRRREVCRAMYHRAADVKTIADRSRSATIHLLRTVVRVDAASGLSAARVSRFR
jgi:hypothetical protein